MNLMGKSGFLCAMSNAKARLGKVLRVQFNVVFIFEEGERGREYAFTLDKVESYGGKHLRDLKQFGKKGLAEGALLKFFADEEHRVVSVRPLVFLE